MDYLFFFNGKVPLSNIPNYLQSLKLVESSLLLDILLQIPILTKLSHDIDVILGHQDLYGSQDMRMGECSQCVDFIIKQVLLDFTLNFPKLKHLDGDGLSVLLVNSLIDVGAKTTPHDHGGVVDVVLDLFHHLLLLLPDYPLH